VESRLTKIGCRLKNVRDGNEALASVRRQSFDVVILRSTGEQMDLLETILNLRDIRPSIPVIVLIDPICTSAGAYAILARAAPEIPIFDLTELLAHLDRSQQLTERSPAACDSLATTRRRPNPPGGKS
jgi:CheY-like chemotaxis protein